MAAVKPFFRGFPFTGATQESIYVGRRKDRAPRSRSVFPKRKHAGFSQESLYFPEKNGHILKKTLR
jgi:hypothetical protein